MGVPNEQTSRIHTHRTADWIDGFSTNLYVDGHVESNNYGELYQEYPDNYSEPPWNFRLVK
ncbi:MAG: hypothetical protein ACOCXX_03520 [Planctomycetota bacterium]